MSESRILLNIGGEFRIERTGSEAVVGNVYDIPELTGLSMFLDAARQSVNAGDSRFDKFFKELLNTGVKTGDVVQLSLDPRTDETVLKIEFVTTKKPASKS